MGKNKPNRPATTASKQQQQAPGAITARNHFGDSSIREAEIIIGADDTVIVNQNKSKFPSKISFPAAWEDKQHYEAEFGSNPKNIFKLEFEEIIVEDCPLPINVQFFLDDTSNGKHGLGNTRFVDLQPIQSPSTDQVHQSMVGVEWYMMGARNGTVPMPNVAKMVVRGSASFCFGNNVPPTNMNTLTGRLDEGEDKPKYMGILGGRTFQIADMLNAFSETGAFMIPIYNSFICTGDMDPCMPPGPLKLCNVYLHMSKDKASKALKEFNGAKAKLFTESKLPCIDGKADAVVQELPKIMSSLFLQRIKSNEYEMPKNAPSNFLQLTTDQQAEVLRKEPGSSMGRSGFTPSAELFGVNFLHSTAAAPAMFNEAEQMACTSNKLFVKSFDAAMKLFAPHGWDLDKLEEECNKPVASDALASFFMSLVSVAHTLPATQDYGFDNMIVKMPGRAGVGIDGWFAVAGENWQVPSSDHPMWDYKKSTGSPCAKWDCESKAHTILNTFLCISAKVQQAKTGGSTLGTNKLDSALQSEFRAAVYDHLNASEDSTSSKGVKAAAERYLGAMCTAFMTMATTANMMIILGKAYSAAASGTESAVGKEQQQMEEREAGGHAYPAIQCNNKDGSITWCMGEGTAAVVNRGHYMHASQGDSNMAMQQGISLIISKDWIELHAKDDAVAKRMLAARLGSTGNQQDSQLAGMKNQNISDPKTNSTGFKRLGEAAVTANTATKAATKASSSVSVVTAKETKLQSSMCSVNFHGIMYQSEIEHTDRFYGDALLSSNALLYSQHCNQKTGKQVPNCLFGSLWFTRNKESGKLSFGGCPEDPYKKNVLFADISGKVIDSMLPAEIRKDGMDFTSLQYKSVQAVREYAGRRVPEAHWDAWIDRMHVKGKHGELQQKHPMPIPFEDAGKVFRIIVTFESADALRQHRSAITSCWNASNINPSIMIAKTQAQMDQVQKVCEAWRSMPSARSQMKCLSHTKKCFEEWQAAGKQAKFAFAVYETLNCMVLTMSCNIPVRADVYNMFEEEAKQPVEKPMAVQPFVVSTKPK